jgi:hypothetical protein
MTEHGGEVTIFESGKPGEFLPTLVAIRGESILWKVAMRDCVKLATMLLRAAFSDPVGADKSLP